MFYKTKIINNISVVVKSSNKYTTLYEFKRAFPYVIGENSSNVDYFEISGVTMPNKHVFYGDTGSTAGSLSFPSDEMVFSTIATDPEDIAREEEMFATELAQNIEYDKLEAVGLVLDPRQQDNLPISTLQSIKLLESDNKFELEGLGTETTITFELDTGINESAVFDTRKTTIIDLQLIKSFKTSNLETISMTSQSSVYNTKIQVVDLAGEIFSLTPTEFDRMFYAVIKMYYDEYIGRTIMKNRIHNPEGANVTEKKAYLNDSSSVSFSAAKTSDASKVYTGESP